MNVMRWLRAMTMILGAAMPLAAPTVRAQTSMLPVNAPTGSVLAAGTAGPPPVGATARRAEVTFQDGQLRIAASNASLNQILREVGRLTGMKMTGGVQEDRVFGTYGPAPTSEVLASLLDGMGTNMLIVDKAENRQVELILSPRRGGPSPPNPNAATMNDGNYEPPPQPLPPQQQYGQPYHPQVMTGAPGMGGLPPSNGGQTGTPINGGADLGTTPGAFTPAGQSPPDATAQPSVQPGSQPSTQPSTQLAPDPNQPQSPNGVSTPQQIYEQLMRLRQQQQQQQPQNPQ